MEDCMSQLIATFLGFFTGKVVYEVVKFMVKRKTK